MTLSRGWQRRFGLRAEAPEAQETERTARREVHLTGVVGEVIAVPRGATFDLVVSLEGETTALVWWGRDAIPGLVCGARLSAYGCPGSYRNQSALLNPTYELGGAHG